MTNSLASHDKDERAGPCIDGMHVSALTSPASCADQSKLPPEVQATVPIVDDPQESCETIRAYLLGTIIAVVGTGLNTWFGARQPGIFLSPLLAQFVSHPLGLLLAKTLPNKSFRLPFCGVTRLSLNPGPWTVKEHTIVTLMATVSFPTATAIDVIVATKLPIFFNTPELGDKLGFQFLIVLSTQFLGFGLAGLSRDFLVYPSSMVWPLNLAKVALFNALHRRKVNKDGTVEYETQTSEQEKGDDPPVHGWRVPSYRFCLYVTAGSFVWFFFTSFIMPFLTYFNWPTWTAPSNKRLAIVMGSITGLGLNPIPTFDWTFISGAGLTPLITPWWATLQIFLGCTSGLLIIIAIYFSNTWYSAYLLPNSNAAFDRFGKSYDVTKVLNPNHTLNLEAFHQYSPLYYTAGYNVLFGSYFAQYSAAILHAILNHTEELKVGYAAGRRQVYSFVSGTPLEDDSYDRTGTDAHFRLMRQYASVPHSWFALVGLLALIMGIICVEVYDTTMPVWGIFLCLALAFLFLVPAGIIMAVSNVQLTLVVLAEIIPGEAIPGRPFANMIFKVYGWISLVQALLYIQDQKLAHYLHVPPQATFRAQMWGCLVGGFITIAVINWQMAIVKDLCSPTQSNLLTCPYYTTFFSSALLFGVIGPRRVYGSHGLYRYLMFAFLVGAALTVIAWLVKRRWPNRFTNAVNVPVFLSGGQYFAPYNWAYVWSGVPLAFTFMRYIYSRFPAWWSRYCYILSIGLTIGAAVSGVIQFFCIILPGGKLTWWGTRFYASGCDGLGCALKEMPKEGYFGPAVSVSSFAWPPRHLLTHPLSFVARSVFVIDYVRQALQQPLYVLVNQSIRRMMIVPT